MQRKYFKDSLGMTNSDAKCLINESELRLDLEERIKEVEDSMELLFAEKTTKENRESAEVSQVV